MSKEKIKGKTYKERVKYQLKEWVRGNPIHNNIDDECCPDFSCCKPKLLSDKKTRQNFLKANTAIREKMCYVFLLKGLDKILPNKKIKVL